LVTPPLPSGDDRAHRRLFAMLSLLAAGGPLARAELLRQAEKLVPLTDEERQRVPESAVAERSGQERRKVDRDLTRAYETLRQRGLLVHPPEGGVWALTEPGYQAVADAEASYQQFWGDFQGQTPPRRAESRRQSPSRTPRAPLNQILYGPPGTGKTYSAVDAALIALGDASAPDELGSPSSSEQRLTRLAAYRDHVEAGRIEFVTFHQAFSYEDFVEGIRPSVSANVGDHTGQIAYGVEPGVFRRVAERASADPLETFVLVIDEINRGNVAGVFGELITLIEEGKRVGQEEELTARLPYSSEAFGVPENLYIIGTMNTADRSLAGVDLALRRRFEFVEMPPKPALLGDVVIEGVDVKKLLTTLNERIESAKGREFGIGHAFFMPLLSCGNGVRLQDLRRVFERKVLPLLQEYFFDDDEQIADVLGQARSGARAHGRSHDYLHRRADAAKVPRGKVVWDTNPGALDLVDFYRQVAGGDVPEVHERTGPGLTGVPGEHTTGGELQTAGGEFSGSSR
jgi:hypothetical protein